MPESKPLSEKVKELGVLQEHMLGVLSRRSRQCGEYELSPRKIGPNAMFQGRSKEEHDWKKKRGIAP